LRQTIVEECRCISNEDCRDNDYDVITLSLVPTFQLRNGSTNLAFVWGHAA
jgi:hypothetical protein